MGKVSKAGNGIGVDWGSLPVRAWAEFQESPGMVTTQVKLLTRVVTACPWGAADVEETYLSDELALDEYEGFVNQVVAMKPPPEDLHKLYEEGEIVFDWNRASVKALALFQENAGRVKGQIALLQRIVTECPWGDPAKADTYLALKLPTYEGLWRLAMEVKREDKFR